MPHERKWILCVKVEDRLQSSWHPATPRPSQKLDKVLEKMQLVLTRKICEYIVTPNGPQSILIGYRLLWYGRALRRMFQRSQLSALNTKCLWVSHSDTWSRRLTSTICLSSCQFLIRVVRAWKGMSRLLLVEWASILWTWAALFSLIWKSEERALHFPKRGSLTRRQHGYRGATMSWIDLNEKIRIVGYSFLSIPVRW